MKLILFHKGDSDKPQRYYVTLWLQWERYNDTNGISIMRLSHVSLTKLQCINVLYMWAKSVYALSLPCCIIVILGIQFIRHINVTIRSPTVKHQGSRFLQMIKAYVKYIYKIKNIPYLCLMTIIRSLGCGLGGRASIYTCMLWNSELRWNYVNTETAMSSSWNRNFRHWLWWCRKVCWYDWWII